MKNGYKTVCRLIVGFALVVLSLFLIYNLIRTVIIPRLPLQKGAEYVQDVSGTMTEPDKTYAVNAISKAARENKIAIILDYQLKTFDITESYIEKTTGNLVKGVYRNQPYIIYTYFKDTQSLVISTNIEKEGIKDIKKVDIDTDARVVKEILYYQQNLSRKMGIRNFNFSLTTEYIRNSIASAVGAIILLILGIGVLPGRIRNPFRRKKTN